MTVPIIMVQVPWWERQLVKMFGRKVWIDGKFAGWIYKGRWFV